MGIHWDRSSKGQDKNLRKTGYHNCWRAEKWVNKVRYRKRFKNYSDAEAWLTSLCAAFGVPVYPYEDKDK